MRGLVCALLAVCFCTGLMAGCETTDLTGREQYKASPEAIKARQDLSSGKKTGQGAVFPAYDPLPPKDIDAKNKDLKFGEKLSK